MKFIITVDTEADNQWKNPQEQTLENLRHLPRFQKLCEQYEFIPTYLVTYEVASDIAVAEMLKAWHTKGKAEVGAHLHPWTTPPFSQEDREGVQTFPNELDREALEQKISSLTKKITENIGVAPTSFRAGRWGFDARMVVLLHDLGYKVDSSVTPYVSWEGFKGKRDGKGGPDFRRAPAKPYMLSVDDVCKQGSGGLLEIPMTVVRTQFFRKHWCRIFPETTCADLQRVYKSAVRQKLPYLQFMIHSSELMVGGSPYTKTSEALEHATTTLEHFFSFLKKQRVEPTTLSAYADIL